MVVVLIKRYELLGIYSKGGFLGFRKKQNPTFSPCPLLIVRDSEGGNLLNKMVVVLIKRYELLGIYSKGGFLGFLLLLLLLLLLLARITFLSSEYLSLHIHLYLLM